MCSLLFYAWGSLFDTAILLICALWTYFTGLEMAAEKRKGIRRLVFIGGVGFNVLVLALFKYISSLHLPVGMSFYIFSAISYLADVYTKKSKVQKKIINMLLYIAFFGKVSMGPIVQYHDMEEQMKDPIVDGEHFYSGVMRFIRGLFKKVVIADQLALLFQSMAGSTSVLGAWVYAISYMLQIYFDFSGYSDMALGIANMFGYEFDENFDHPYTAVSVQDFWRRWHISLSRWFRDYIYIPLGGSRVNTVLYIRNILVVWILTGIWHGASYTFIIWGLYYACLLLVERFILRNILSKLPVFIQRMYTLLLVLIGWIFFFSNSLSSAFSVIGRLFGAGGSGLTDGTGLFLTWSNLVVLLIAIFGSSNLERALENRLIRSASPVTMSLVYILVFIISVCFVVGSTYQSFLYAAF
jgi:alginate O-acetyltransferase complex protein AlgI